MLFRSLNARLHGFSPLLKRRQRRGFTLTEIAIVLGVTGIALAGIWVGIGQVGNANKMRIFVGEVQRFVENYHKMFSGHGIDMAYGTDITCMGITAGVFPSEMIPAGLTCTPSVSGTNGYTGTQNVITPWGGNTFITVNVDTDGDDRPGGFFKPPDVIKVYFNNLTQQQCISMATAILATPGVVLISFSNGWAHFVNGYNDDPTPTPTPALIATNCTASAGLQQFAAGFLIK